MMNGLKSFCEGFRDGFKVTGKLMLTVGVLSLIGLAAFSGPGLLFAGPMVNNTMEAIWGDSDEV